MLKMRGVKENMTNMEWHNLIFFDGVCELCNSSIDFILKRDKKKLLIFASLQTEEDKKVIIKNKIQQVLKKKIKRKINSNEYFKKGATIKVVKKIEKLNFSKLTKKSFYDLN